MNENNIQQLSVRLGLVTVEDVNQYTVIQLVMMIANKINELILAMDEFEGDVQSSLKTQNDKIQYLLGKGLMTEVLTVFETWLTDGTFEELINQTALNSLTTRISDIEEDYGLLNLPPESDITDVLKNILEVNSKTDKKSVVLLPNSVCYISDTIIIKKDKVHIKGGCNTELRKKANVPFFKIYAQQILISSILFVGNNNYGYDDRLDDTTSGIILGRNNGDNNFGPNTVYPNDCELHNVRIEHCGNHGFDWQEGRGLRLNGFISAYNTNDGIYVSDKAVDANHATFTFAEMMRNGGNGITNIKYSNFTNLKLFENKLNGCVLEGGNVGTIYSENNGIGDGKTPAEHGVGIVMKGTCNNINVQWLNDKWDDVAGTMHEVSRNYIQGISLPTADRSYGQRLTKTNQILIGKGFAEPVSSEFSNWVGLLTKPTSKNDITESVLGTGETARKIIDKGTASKLQYIFNPGTELSIGGGVSIRKITASNHTITETVPAKSIKKVSIGNGAIKTGVCIKAFIRNNIPDEILIQESLTFDEWATIRLYNTSDHEVSANIELTLVVIEFSM